jgi:putative FmdB family regulatory protein
MPTYVYECSSCNDRFEVEQRITENALENCPCGSKGTVKRIIQPVGIMFKGSGFHINDYSVKSEAKADSPAESTPTPVTEKAAPATEAAAPAAKPAGE